MNINNVYLANIYVKTTEKPIPDSDMCLCNADFVKEALVYNKTSMYGICYVDLETKRKYKTFQLGDAVVGEMFICLEQGVTPLESIIEVNKKNMSKRKILKKFNDYVENNNE